MALAKKLKIRRAEAVGLMENLWHWAADEVPDGGVGKYSNEMIADSIMWDRPNKSYELIEALTDGGLLDEGGECRLYIHDWHQHCEISVHKRLARNGLFFANGEQPSLTGLDLQEKQRIKAKYERRGYPADTQRIPNGCPPDTGITPPDALPKPKPKPKPESSPYPLKNQDPETESGEVSKEVLTWRKAFKILSEEPALARLTYEHVMNAARAFPDVDLLEEAKKMAGKSRNFVNGIDEPGLWVWSWLQRCQPGTGGAVPTSPAFDPKKEYGGAE